MEIFCFLPLIQLCMNWLKEPLIQSGVKTKQETAKEAPPEVPGALRILMIAVLMVSCALHPKFCGQICRLPLVQFCLNEYNENVYLYPSEVLNHEWIRNSAGSGRKMGHDTSSSADSV